MPKIKSTRPKDSAEARKSYLTEHVAYERAMLGYTFERLHDTPPGFQWNAVYESFGIHARNLYDFLRNEGEKQTTFRADDYVQSWKKPPPLLRFNGLNAFLFHMSTRRADHEKLKVARLEELGDWIDEYWAEWVSALPPPYVGIPSPDPMCVVRALATGVTAETACTAVTAFTVSTIPPTTSSISFKAGA